VAEAATTGNRERKGRRHYEPALARVKHFPNTDSNRWKILFRERSDRHDRCVL